MWYIIKTTILLYGFYVLLPQNCVDDSLMLSGVRSNSPKCETNLAHRIPKRPAMCESTSGCGASANMMGNKTFSARIAPVRPCVNDSTNLLYERSDATEKKDNSARINAKCTTLKDLEVRAAMDRNMCAIEQKVNNYKFKYFKSNCRFLVMRV